MSSIIPGTPQYFAWLYSDPRQQALLAALLGIESEINAALEPGLEHSVAHVRMTWWAEEAQRLRSNHALHPASRALLAQRPAAAEGPGPDVSGLVDLATWDLAGATFESRRELTGYCQRWAAAVFERAALWGAPDQPVASAKQFGAGAGAAVCELGLLIGVQHDARRGRLRLPLDELAALHVAPEALAHTPWPPALCEWLRTRHAEVRAALAQACAALELPGQRAALRGLLVWAALSDRHSRRAGAALPASWQRSRWDGLGDALSAWRTARRAMRH